jgi:hypothetical protein
MLKITLAYLAGALTIGAAVFAAGGRATLISFAIGALFTALLLVAAISSPRRQRAAARLLSNLANVLDPKTPRRPAQPRPAAAAPPTPSQTQLDVAAALVNFGAPKNQAARLAREATANGEEFQEAFRRAVSLSKVAA